MKGKPRSRARASSTLVSSAAHSAVFEDSAIFQKKRQNLRSARNRLAKHPEISFRRVQGARELDAAIASFHQHSVTRLGEKGVASTLIDPQMSRFFFGIIRSAAASGHGETFAAYDGQRLIGTLFALHFGRWICYYNGSFDVSYSQLSVGRLLVDELVRYAIEQGFAELDLLAGSGDYKQRWAPGTHERLQYASLVKSPLASLPFTLWDAWKSADVRPLSAGEPSAESSGLHPLQRIMKTTRGLLARLPSSKFQ